MASIRVEVTADQIAAAGDDRHAWAEPVEAALAVLTGQEVDIDAGGSASAGEHWSIATIGQGAWTIVVDLPETANAWLEARWGHDEPSGAGSPTELVDRGEPFSFELEVPTWVINLVRGTEWLTLTAAARALGLKPVTLRSAANQLREGAVSDDGLAGRLGIRRVGRDWLVPLDRLEAEVARRAEPAL